MPPVNPASSPWSLSRKHVTLELPSERGSNPLKLLWESTIVSKLGNSSNISSGNEAIRLVASKSMVWSNLESLKSGKIHSMRFKLLLMFRYLKPNMTLKQSYGTDVKLL